MGCAKNLVDSEKLMGQLRLSNVEIAATVNEADVVVINTCGFIGAAKEESIDTIIQHVRMKSQGRLKKIYAMGCLTERYRRDLAGEIPEVDRFFGSNQLPDVLRELGADYKYALLGERVITTPRHYAYLKISEGCDNPCSFCAIPLMRGRHISRPIESILDEAKLLAEKGVHELAVIAQDTTYYGVDVYGRRRLPELLQRLADVQGIRWVRLMYAYPAKFPLEILDVIAGHPGICKYLDMPVQHCADRVLKSMRRGISRRALTELITTIRERVPGIALRTTLIVGYPDEGDREFQELMEFVREVRFDRLGVFAYSQEDGTTAFPLGDPVPVAEKDRRLAAVMELQKQISREENEKYVGTRQTVVIDRQEEDVFVGRTQKDAPEIDNEVYVHSTLCLHIGDFYEVDIEDTSEYDMYGAVRTVERSYEAA